MSLSARGTFLLLASQDLTYQRETLFISPSETCGTGSSTTSSTPKPLARMNSAALPPEKNLTSAPLRSS